MKTEFPVKENKTPFRTPAGLTGMNRALWDVWRLDRRGSLAMLGEVIRWEDGEKDLELPPPPELETKEKPEVIATAVKASFKLVNCKICGEEFSTRSLTALYCSDKCRRETIKTTRECVGCGQEIVVYGTTKRFCSDACSKAYRRREERNRKAKELAAQQAEIQRVETQGAIQKTNDLKKSKEALKLKEEERRIKEEARRKLREARQKSKSLIQELKAEAKMRCQNPGCGNRLASPNERYCSPGCRLDCSLKTMIASRINRRKYK